jgi:DNA-binding NtrC family response regulator
LVSNRRTVEKTVPPSSADTLSALLIGNSARMRAVYKEIGRVATKPVTVLIRGATGTGKGLVARAIHEYSDRQKQPFVAVNCTATP